MFGRKRTDADFNAELEAHIQLEAERLREQGVPEREAQAAARRAFGNVMQAHERFYESSRWLWWEHLRQDLRYAIRMLAKNPGFTATAILTLALGIGANTAIFSLIDAVMLRFLPISHPDELMQIERVVPKRSEPSPVYTNAIWEQVRDRQDVFTGAFAWSDDKFDLAEGGAVNYASGLWVSGGFFQALHMHPAAGRLLTTSDDQPGCPAEAVLGYGFWRERFGGDPRAVGANISLNHHRFQVIGVTAAGFSGLEVGKSMDVAVPLCASAIFDGKEPRLQHRSWWWLRVGGRVRPGLKADQVNARLAVLSPAIFAGSVPTNWDPEGRRIFTNSKLQASFMATGVSGLRRQFAKPLYILMAMVGIVLLIACSNIASLTMARTTARNKEIAVRQALGASRVRLIRQLLTECLLLAAAGALLGILFARWGTAVLVQYLSTSHSQVFLDLTPDSRVLGFTAAVAFLTALLFGLTPALRGTRLSLAAAMKGPSDAERGAHFRPAKWIVGGQVALSLVLLVAAGLLLRSFARLVTLDAGFDRSRVLLVQTHLEDSEIPVERQEAMFRAIEDRLQSLPGVKSISRSWNTPVTGYEWNENITVDTEHPITGDAALTYFNFVSPSYFDTLRTDLLAGRRFTASDSKSAPKVAMVNQTLARRFFPGLDPLGHTFRTGGPPNQPQSPIQIVGVVKDSKYESLRENTPPTAFFPLAQVPRPLEFQTFELRTAVVPSMLVKPVQDAVMDVNKAASLDLNTLDQQVADSLVEERLLALLSGFFGALALLLAMIGLYGTLSYLVTQRYTEFGIRIALGARPATILSLVGGDVMAVLAGGLTAGICLALATTRYLQQMLFGLGARDSATMIAAISVLAAVAFLAAYFPARRATKVDPMVALRYD